MSKKIEEVFSSEYMQPLEGLLFVGKLTKTIEYSGHTFQIRTLTQGEELRVGQLTREYMGQYNQMAAIKAYIVAACVELVDGLPMYVSIGDEQVDPIAIKVERVKRWYEPVVSFIHDQYAELYKMSQKVADELKKS